MFLSERRRVHTFLLVILVMMAIIFLHGAKVEAAELRDGEYFYTVINDEAQITGYFGVGGNVTIPNTLGGSTVKSIARGAFIGCEDLTSITIPQGVTDIGDGAFSDCSNLENIDIPDGVTSIGDGAFQGCKNLTDITIPTGVTRIGNDTFSNCSNLCGITIPEGVTSIGDNAFSLCVFLGSITLPQSITSIGNRAFFSCLGLTDFTIPQGVTSIGDAAFCSTGLTSITIPSSVTRIGDDAFSLCEGLSSITFNSTTTEIYFSAGTIPETTRIIGYVPSTAKTYSERYHRKFQNTEKNISSNASIILITIFVLICLGLVLIILRIKKVVKARQPVLINEESNRS